MDCPSRKVDLLRRMEKLVAVDGIDLATLWQPMNLFKNRQQLSSAIDRSNLTNVRERGFDLGHGTQ